VLNVVPPTSEKVVEVVVIVVVVAIIAMIIVVATATVAMPMPVKMTDTLTDIFKTKLFVVCLTKSYDRRR
jgi:CDP-diacylglycerol pyrophosphatase